MKKSQRLFLSAIICSISMLAGCGDESERQKKNEAAQRQKKNWP
jgi:outer membrane murein-binding lipoprotein Lpp